MARNRGRPEHEAKYKKLRNEVVSFLRKVNLQTETYNSKEFWKAIKNVQKHKSSIPNLTGNISSDSEKANALNAHISKCYNPIVPPLCDDNISSCNPDACPDVL